MPRRRLDTIRSPLSCAEAMAAVRAATLPDGFAAELWRTSLPVYSRFRNDSQVVLRERYAMRAIAVGPHWELFWWQSEDARPLIRLSAVAKPAVGGCILQIEYRATARIQAAMYAPILVAPLLIAAALSQGMPAIMVFAFSVVLAFGAVMQAEVVRYFAARGNSFLLQYPADAVRGTIEPAPAADPPPALA